MTYSDASTPDASEETTLVDVADEPPPPPGDAGDDGFDPCDQDHDMHRAKGACGGDDCNDNDPRVHPGLTQFVTDVPDAAPFGDWNCDGTVQYQYPAVTCAVTCSTSEGFPSPGPGCGFSAEYVDCTNVTCALADAGIRVQGCL
ncbi:MAG TPA: hypothetical protein VGH28_06450 [Polyangiaceae bacterium]